MPHILKNEKLEIWIDMLLENCQFPRFDWTGKITSILFKGISVFTSEKLDEENRYAKGF